MKRWRVVEMTLAWIGAASFLTGWLLSFWLRSEMPTHSVGDFAIPTMINGRTVYVSQLLDIAHSVLLWGGLSVFALAALVDTYKDPFRWRRPRGK
jgi:hypothetical protein